jgi:ubiquinol-cytochrome c reductase cytochrome c subunit
VSDANGSRRGRALAGWVAVAAAACVALVWQSSAAPAQPEPAGDVDLALGGELYSAWCVHCHGSAGQGVVGEGVQAGPAVDDVDVRYHDLLLRTGRMPIVDPRVGIIVDPGFSDTERESLVAWMADAFDLPGELPTLTGTGDVANGGDLYAMHCAACHGGGGVGGVSGGGATVRKVQDVEPEAIVEAIRVGPFAMPRFSEAVIDDGEAEDIAAFVTAMSEDYRTPLRFREPHRVTMAAMVLPLLVAVVGCVFMAAHAGTKRGR